MASKAGKARRTSPPARLKVEVVAPAAFPVRGLGRWLERVAPAAARGEVTVALVPDARVAKLNATFRGRNYPTDVLSFPAQERPFLGDIVIARGVARRQAAQAGHSLETEVRVLSLHGLLHLLGYDHEQDDGEMAGLERRLRRKGGLVEGLIERADLATDPRTKRRRSR